MIKLAACVLVLFAVEVQSYINLSDVSCGVTGARSGRVVGGSDARPTEFPWLASLTRRGGHFCGATILNRRWLLTAGHCICSGTNEILPASVLRATLGEHDLKQAEEPRSQVMRLDRIIPHPGYSCGKQGHDIALIRLAEDATWSAAIAPACLPEGSDDFAGKLATVAGWGWLNEDNEKGTRADVLQKVDVNVLQNQLCQEWYKSQGKKNKISPEQMCAGDEQGGKDSCWADSGGPLMWSQQGEPTPVIGVVSTGIGCGRARLPGLYTRVSEYMDWIQKTVSLN